MQTRGDTPDNLRTRGQEDRAWLRHRMQPVALADGSTLRCARLGRGSPVVCLPMVAETNHVYVPQIRALAQRHEFLVYEPRLSATTRVSVRDRATEIELLLDALDIAAAHVFAWSDTGSAAYDFARRRPDRCRSLCLLGLADRYTFPLPLHLIIRLVHRHPSRWLSPSPLLRLLLGHYLSGDRVKARWIREEARSIPRFAELFTHSVLPNIVEHRPVAGEIRVPVLALCGDRDALLTVAQARRMAELIGHHCDFQVVAGGEHFLPYTSPEPVTQALAAFYASLERRERRGPEGPEHQGEGEIRDDGNPL
ncbi:alpha/beta hydrolase [Streptomyces sp. BPTC-684]|uniref:alpha/beta fold hydrolase n=1 Tax=Streptomyces sp. BPTC-684 TaxID=3043734 RepID=UPI0024B15863|nr:alpha/beta hydrolase [Streptomyces sp. BPTC-684]WHM41083.1 alpha/beta hydrolase [Streptomyces sp. BPTC-684]